MTLDSDETQKRYQPLLSEAEVCQESADEYCIRVQKILPFPADVLRQWFYDHWEQIHRNAWLDLENLTFCKFGWSTEQVMQSGIFERESVRCNHEHFESGTRCPPFGRIAQYFDANGTWPVAPILIPNPNGEVICPREPITSPYHIIEGSHRAAIFWSFSKAEKLANTHSVWIAKFHSNSHN